MPIMILHFLAFKIVAVLIVKIYGLPDCCIAIYGGVKALGG